MKIDIEILPKIKADLLSDYHRMGIGELEWAKAEAILGTFITMVATEAARQSLKDLLGSNDESA